MANKNHSQLDAIICVSSERWSQLWLYSIRYFAIGIYWIVVTGNGKFVVQWPDFCVKANTPISLYHNFRHQIRCFRSDNDRQRRNPKNKWKTNIPQPSMLRCFSTGLHFWLSVSRNYIRIRKYSTIIMLVGWTRPFDPSRDLLTQHRPRINTVRLPGVDIRRNALFYHLHRTSTLQSLMAKGIPQAHYFVLFRSVEAHGLSLYQCFYAWRLVRHVNVV